MLVGLSLINNVTISRMRADFLVVIALLCV